MDRISTSMISGSALLNLGRAQRDLADYTRQSSTGLKANDLKGYGFQAQTLVSSDRLISRVDSFIGITAQLKSRMELQDVALDQAAKMVSTLRDDIFQSVALNSGEGIMQRVQDTFDTLKQAMNSQVGGRYLFGGTLNDRPPVIAASLDSLRDTPLDNAFQQGAQKQQIRIEEHRIVDAAPLAADAISAAFASLKAIAELNGGEALTGTLSAYQRSTLEAELSNLVDAYQAALGTQSRAGQVLAEVDKSSERLTAQKNALNGALSGIVSVDLAEVAVKLNQAQFAYEASASIFASVRDLTLLNYLS